MKWIILVTALVLNAVANILIKLGMIGSGDFKSKILSLYFIGGLTCFGLALVAYSLSLRSLNLSIAYPIMTTGGFIIIGLFSWMFLKETISLVQIIGFVFLLIGIWLVSLSKVN